MEIKLLKDYPYGQLTDNTKELFKELEYQINIMVQEFKDGKRLKQQLLIDLKDELLRIGKYLFEYRKFIDTDKKEKCNESNGIVEAKAESNEESETGTNAEEKTVPIEEVLIETEIAYRRKTYPQAIEDLNNYSAIVQRYLAEIERSSATITIKTNNSETESEMMEKPESKEQKVEQKDNFEEWQDYGIEKGILKNDGKTIFLSDPAKQIHKLKLAFPKDINIDHDFIKENFRYERKNKTTNETEIKPYADSTIDKMIEKIKELERQREKMAEKNNISNTVTEEDSPKESKPLIPKKE